MTQSLNKSDQHSHAFRVGYRMGLRELPLQSAPPYIQNDDQQFSEFHDGWKHAQIDMEEQKRFFNPNKKRARLIWFFIMMVGGIFTAYGLIHSIEAEQQTDKVTALSQQNVTPKDMRILSDQARADLVASTPQINVIQELAVTASDSITAIQIKLLAANDETLQLPVSKQIRSIKAAISMTSNIAESVQLKWIWQDQLVTEKSFTLTIGANTFVENMNMTSARQGEWRVELWQGRYVIAREKFNYVK